MRPGSRVDSKSEDNEGGYDRPGSPQEGLIPLLGARIQWESLVDRSPDGAGCGRRPWEPAGVDLDTLSDVPRDGASEVPADLPRAGNPIHIVGFHRYVPPDSRSSIKMLGPLELFQKEAHAPALGAHESADRTL